MILRVANLLLIGLRQQAPRERTAGPDHHRGEPKVCQLTGDVDWETGQPTAARTFTNFGLDAVDLGYPVEHNGKLSLLFGDTRPNQHGGGPGAETPPDDIVGFTTRRAPPGHDGKCVELQLNDQIGDPGSSKKTLAPPTIVGPFQIKQGLVQCAVGRGERGWRAIRVLLDRPLHRSGQARTCAGRATAPSAAQPNVLRER